MEMTGHGQSLEDARELAQQIDNRIAALELRNTPHVRAIRREYSRQLKAAPADLVLALAQELLQTYDHRSVAYELIQNHDGAYRRLDAPLLERLGAGINSWWTVDSFGRTLAGPAWRDGLIADGVIHQWAGSEDRWWRRAALVTTVALNVRSHGGDGDVPRTLAVCEMLVDDREDTVVKAMSWALRELVAHDPDAVSAFLASHGQRLAARVKREVRNKIETGLKNPRRQTKRIRSDKEMNRR
jgi:3-methyladenine DNA glycosylase AlkD